MFWVVLFGCACVATVAWRRRHRPRLPPGPRGFPLLGSVLQIPSKLLFLKLDEWKKEFGNIFSFSVIGQRFVIVNQATVAADVLDRMSAQTSGRPNIVMPDIMTGGMVFSFLSIGDRWRRARRIAHESFNSRAVERYCKMQENEAMDLVKRLMAKDPDLRLELDRMSTSSIWRAFYGVYSQSGTLDMKIERMAFIMRTLLKATSPTAYLVNLFPVLRSLPSWLGDYTRFGREFFSDVQISLLQFLMEGRQQTDHGAGFLISCANAAEKSDLSDKEIAWTFFSLFGAAVETTAFSLQFFVIAMIRNPEVARKAQAEIEAVVGTQPPTFDHREKLPYITAMVKELLRWRPVVPLGLPHLATADCTYNGFQIPAGSYVIANIWSMCRDPAIFADFDTFRPERYLNSSGGLKEPLEDYHDDMLGFGYGRRICPGRAFASNSLFINIAHLLWAFDFCAGVDQKGMEILPPTMNFVDEGLLVYPAPFMYLLKPRRDVLAGLSA